VALSDVLTQTAGQLAHLGRADFAVFEAGAADPTSSVLPLSLGSRVKAESGVSEVAPMQLVVGGVSQLMGIEPNGLVARYLVVESGAGVSPGRVDVGDVLARQLHVQPGDLAARC
jgi:hypothetical protein